MRTPFCRLPIVFVLWPAVKVTGQAANAVSGAMDAAASNIPQPPSQAQASSAPVAPPSQAAASQSSPPSTTQRAPTPQGVLPEGGQAPNNVLPEPTRQQGTAQQCPETCLPQMIGDGWCNTECAIPECENDKADCNGWCAPDCRKEWIGDKWCDRDCFRQECNWDQGDCDSLFQHGDVRFPPQPHEAFDYTSCDCERKHLHNGKCDAACNTKECNWDGNDCRHQCAPGCVSAWQGDGECDSACFNEACGYDKGDCEECSPGCRPDRIGNGICDGTCMTDACHWDMGDCAGVCKVYPVDYNELPFEYNQCRSEWEGDGFCDCFCLNSECNNDKGDCEGQEEECAVKIANAESRQGGVYPTPIPGSAQDLARRRATSTTTPKVIGSRDRGFVAQPTSGSPTLVDSGVVATPVQSTTLLGRILSSLVH